MLQYSITRLLTMGAALILLLILTLAAFTTYRVAQIRHNTQTLADLYARNSILLTDLRAKVLLIGFLVRDFLLNPDPVTRNLLQSQLSHAHESFSLLQTLPLEDEKGEELIRLGRRYLELNRHVLNLIQQGQYPQAQRSIFEELSPVRQRLIQLLEELGNTNVQAWAAQTEQTEELVQGFFMGSLLTFGITFVLAVAVLGGLIRTVGHQARELEEKTQSLEGFAATVAHDLRTPLSAISGFAKLMRKRHSKDVPDEMRDALKRIEANVRNMDNMISELLFLAKAGQEVDEPSPIDLESLLRDVSENLAPRLRQTTGSISWPVDLPIVSGDPGRIRQIFQNLLENATKFNREGVPLEIRVTGRLLDRWSEFRVQDNGQGIPPDHLHHIFEPFVRIQTPKATGTGLGLATVRRIVTAHGGTIRVESEPGKGTVFIFTLPSAATDQDTQPGPHESPPG